ncbi:hypothetical protein AURDEDRAFT_113815 [Auricularia subglabra TFB-10046 SS5]|nr:hypothetical protein AURDEDRAFT_113815 [Auricularia subglabra TFB-10046 SS5]
MLIIAAAAPVWSRLYINARRPPQENEYEEVVSAVNAGVPLAHTSVSCRRTPLWELATALDKLAYTSKQLRIDVWKWDDGLEESFQDGHAFANLVDLEVSNQIQGNMLMTLLLRAPALKHLTLAMIDDCIVYPETPDVTPPFILEEFTCRGECWFEDAWWTWWPVSNLGTKRLRSFAFEGDESHAFSTCFDDPALAHLLRALTTARLFLYYSNSQAFTGDPGNIKQTLRRDAAILKRCTSLRVLQVNVDWPSEGVQTRLKRVFASLRGRIRALELYAIRDTTPAQMAAADSFLAAQLRKARGLSALTDLTVSCQTEYSLGETFPMLLRACHLRRIRFQSSNVAARR